MFGKKIKKIIKYTPFYPHHIGGYIRNLYFWRYCQKLPMGKFGYVLDAGCGKGDYAKKLAIRYPFLKIDACDIKEDESWADKPANVIFKKINLLKLKEKNFYDLCFSIDVVEHIRGNYKVLINICQALKQGGYFYLHLPSKTQRTIFPSKFFREFNEWGKIEHVGEKYDYERLKQIINSLGFKIIESRKTFGFWGSFAWEIDRMTDKMIVFKVLTMPLLKLFSRLDLYFPSLNGNGILILATKR